MWTGGRNTETPGLTVVTQVTLSKSAHLSDDQIFHLRHLESWNRYSSGPFQLKILGLTFFASILLVRNKRETKR